MSLIFTTHAKKRMIERSIRLKEIKEVLELPDYIVTKDGKIEAYKKINSKTLKIVYHKKGDFIKIITLILK